MATLLAWPGATQPPAPARIAIDEPADGAVFPPGMVPPVFTWRDPASAAAWSVEIRFSNGSPALHFAAKGERLTLGEIDPRCVSPNNQLPALTGAGSRRAHLEARCRRLGGHQGGSVAGAATVTITGFRTPAPTRTFSRGQSPSPHRSDPVGAPIFYRDVPLMPCGTGKGRHQAAAARAPCPDRLAAARRRPSPSSRLVMQGMPTCANCHSFSRDGKTLGMDVDGPQNDKGLYAIAPAQAAMSIRNEDVITWSSFREPAGRQTAHRFHVAGLARRPDTPSSHASTRTAATWYNFKDYRFLQVFYPTRGILAWYDRATRRTAAPCPAPTTRATCRPTASGVPTASTWSSPARRPGTPIPEGRRLAEYANDPDGDADPVRPLPHPLQRRQRRPAGADRGRLATTA